MSIRIPTPDVVPRQYAGKWVAWTPDGLHILGAGDTPAEAKRAAETRGIDPTIRWSPGMGVAYEWVPPADERFLGSLPR